MQQKSWAYLNKHFFVAGDHDVNIAASNVRAPVDIPRRRSITTPSRRRRIIYETARHIVKLHLQNGLDDNIRQQRASTSIQSCIRRYLDQSRFELIIRRRHYCVTRIQAQERTRQAKVDYLCTCRILKQKNAVQKQEMAATVISALIRRHIAAQYVKLLRAENQYEEKITSMATHVQRFIRGAQARNKVEEMRLVHLHKECAAIVIQSFVRTIFTKYTYISSRYQHKIEPSVYLIQRAFRKHLAVQYHEKRLVSSIRLQSWWRMIAVLLAKSTFHVERDNASSDKSISLISPDLLDIDSEDDKTRIREKEIRSNLDSLGESFSTHSLESEASVNIQDRESDGKLIQAPQMTIVDVQLMKLEAFRMENAARIIQSFASNFLIRKRYLQANYLVNRFVDHSIDRITKKKIDEIRTTSASKIQSLFRGNLGRQKAEFLTRCLYREIMNSYDDEFSTFNWIPDNIQTQFGNFMTRPKSAGKEEEVQLIKNKSCGCNPGILNEPFLSEFFKYLPESSMPMAGCDIIGIDLDDPNNLISWTLDFSMQEGRK